MERTKEKNQRRVEMSDWKVPKNIFEVQDLKNQINNNQIQGVFEKANAINWLKINGYWEENGK